MTKKLGRLSSVTVAGIMPQGGLAYQCAIPRLDMYISTISLASILLVFIFSVMYVASGS